MNNAEGKVFKAVCSANTVDCCRLLAVGSAAAACREKSTKDKASFRFKTFYRMTMAAMLGRHAPANHAASHDDHENSVFLNSILA